MVLRLFSVVENLTQKGYMLDIETKIALPDGIMEVYNEVCFFSLIVVA